MAPAVATRAARTRGRKSAAIVQSTPVLPGAPQPVQAKLDEALVELTFRTAELVSFHRLLCVEVSTPEIHTPAARLPLKGDRFWSNLQPSISRLE